LNGIRERGGEISVGEERNSISLPYTPMEHLCEVARKEEGRYIVGQIIGWCVVRKKKGWELLENGCHPCAGTMLIFSVSFQF